MLIPDTVAKVVRLQHKPREGGRKPVEAIQVELNLLTKGALLDAAALLVLLVLMLGLFTRLGNKGSRLAIVPILLLVALMFVGFYDLYKNSTRYTELHEELADTHYREINWEGVVGLNPDRIAEVHEEDRTQAMCETAVAHDARNIVYCPDGFITCEMIENARNDAGFQASCACKNDWANRLQGLYYRKCQGAESPST